MESYPLSFTALKGKNTLPASGDLFVYESAVAATNAETRIRVKPDNGGVVILRPGQWFRNPNKVTNWALESYNGNDVIDSVFVIGFGEFGDANTLNKFTLDASLTNSVTVTNSTAQRVPVTMDTSQLLKLDPNTVVNIAGNTVQYTNSYANNSGGALSPGVVFTPASNPNGAYIEFAEVALNTNSTTATALVSLIAKSTAPVNDADGDVVMLAASGGSTGSTVASAAVCALTQRIKIAAGKGLYVWQNSNAYVANKTVLYTLL